MRRSVGVETKEPFRDAGTEVAENVTPSSVAALLVFAVVDQNVFDFEIAMNERRIRMVKSRDGFDDVAEHLQHFRLREATTCARRAMERGGARRRMWNVRERGDCVRNNH